MSHYIPVIFGDGKIWYVGSRAVPQSEQRHQTKQHIIIPTEELDGLSDAEIGAMVRECAFSKDFCYALDLAAEILEYPNVIGQFQYNATYYTTLQRYAGADPHIDQALALLHQSHTQTLASQNQGSRPGYVYLVRAGEYHKIGKTSKVHQRMRDFGLQLPFPFELLHAIPVADMTDAESLLHKRFAAKRLNGEWFALSTDDVAAICSIETIGGAV